MSPPRHDIDDFLSFCTKRIYIARPSFPSMNTLTSTIKKTKNSAPGPDGIPFACWQGLGKLAVDVLTNVMTGLCGDNGEAALADMGWTTTADALRTKGFWFCCPRSLRGPTPAAPRTSSPQAPGR